MEKKISRELAGTILAWVCEEGVSWRKIRRVCKVWGVFDVLKGGERKGGS